jgi:hypothetical protein
MSANADREEGWMEVRRGVREYENRWVLPSERKCERD